MKDPMTISKIDPAQTADQFDLRGPVRVELNGEVLWGTVLGKAIELSNGYTAWEVWCDVPHWHEKGQRVGIVPFSTYVAEETLRVILTENKTLKI